MSPLLVLAVLVCFGSSFSSPDSSPVAAAQAPATLCLAETNDERRKNGNLKPLTWDTKLANAAKFHNDIMVNTPCFNHQCTEVNEPDLGARLKAVAYPFHRYGENIAYGQGNCSRLMSDWMSSDGHKGNILYPDYTNVGCASGGTNPIKWTCVFGLPW